MTDERLKKIEKTLQHLSRRAPGRTVAIVPPTLVSFFVKQPSDDGVLCSFISPVEAEVTTIAFTVSDSQIAKDSTVVIAHTGHMITAMEIPLRYNKFVQNVSYKLSPGDVLQVSINHPDMIHDVSISIVLKLAENSVEHVRLQASSMMQESENA